MQVVDRLPYHGALPLNPKRSQGQLCRVSAREIQVSPEAYPIPVDLCRPCNNQYKLRIRS